MTVYVREERDPLGYWMWRLIVFGALASIVCIVGGIFDPAQFFRAYMFAYLYFLGLSLGAMVLVMIHSLTGGAWGLLIRRIGEAQMKTLPLLALLFLPICFGLKHIFLWADPSVDTFEETQIVQRYYLQPWFFYVRAAVYFATWLALVFFFSLWSKKQDDADDVRTLWKENMLAGPGLVAFGITLHFAAIDWQMSLQTHFKSTMNGPLLFSSELLSAYAVTVLLFCLLMARPEYGHVFSMKAMNDLGSLLFTFLILWAYMAWFQFMLIWIADLPHGTVWYLAHFRDGWNWFAAAGVVLHFVVPFFLLLFRAVKCSRVWLGSVAGAIAFMQLLFIFWQVIPVFNAPGLSAHWMDFLAPVGIGGLWGACLLWVLRSRPLLPRYDAVNYPRAFLLHELDEEENAREQELAHA